MFSGLVTTRIASFLLRENCNPIGECLSLEAQFPFTQRNVILQFMVVGVQSWRNMVPTITKTASSQRLSSNSSHHLFLIPTAVKLIACIRVIWTVSGRPKLCYTQDAVSARRAFSHTVPNSLLQLNFTTVMGLQTGIQQLISLQWNVKLDLCSCVLYLNTAEKKAGNS